jgi:hypothetical protein
MHMNIHNIAVASFSITQKIPYLLVYLWRKTWRYSLVVLVILIIGHTVLNIIAGRRLDAELRKIRSAGQPVTPTEIDPPIPDKQNAAALYLYVFSEETGPIDTKQLLSSKEWPKRGSRFFISWEEQQILDGFRYKNKAASEPGIRRPTIAEVKAIFAKYQREIQLLQKASLMSSCRFPVNWQDGWGALFPHFSGVRNTTRFFATKALVDAQSGDAASAIDDLATAVRIIDHFCVGSILLDELLHTACLQIVASVLPRIITDAPLSESQARAFYDTLGRMDRRASFTRAMAGERCAGISGFDTARKEGPKFFMNVTEDSGIGWRVLQCSWPLMRYFAEPFIRLDEVSYLRQMEQAVELTRKPFFEAALDYRKLDAETHSPKVSLSEMPIDSYGPPQMKRISQIVLPTSLTRFAVRSEEGAAFRELMRITMVLSAYRFKHGKYPGNLLELRTLGWSIAPDPFTGKDFVYRRHGKGYLLYSLGSDGRDNAGIDFTAAAKQARSKGQSVENITYDISLCIPPKTQ